MKITLGTNKETNQPLVWNSDTVTNRHMIIVGESGSGKTYTLRGLIHGLATSTEHPKIYVFDPHSDISTSLSLTNTIEFGEDSNYGLQPLAVNSDPRFGGVRRSIKNFITVFNAFNRSTGDIQQRLIEDMLEKMYAYFGFFRDDPETWHVHIDKRDNKRVEKRQPTVKDLIEFIKNRQMEDIYGIGDEVAYRLKKVEKAIKKIKRTHSKDLMNEDEESEKNLKAAKEEAVEVFKEFVDSKWELGGLAKNMSSANSKQLDSVLKRIENLYNSGLFKESEFAIDNGLPVQRLDIRALKEEEQKGFVLLTLERIFEQVKELGETKELRTVIVLDEAKDYIDKERGYIEKIALDGRKFGLQLILAGQALSQFHKDTVGQCATKIILGVDQMYYAETSSKFNISKALIDKIIIKKNILVSMKDDIDYKAKNFVEVEI